MGEYLFPPFWELLVHFFAVSWVYPFIYDTHSNILIRCTNLYRSFVGCLSYSPGLNINISCLCTRRDELYRSILDLSAARDHVIPPDFVQVHPTFLAASCSAVLPFFFGRFFCEGFSVFVIGHIFSVFFMFLVDTLPDLILYQ